MHFLAFTDDVFRYRMDSVHREISLLCNTIPRHPNIMPPLLRLVYVAAESLGSRRVVGILYEYYRNGNVVALIERKFRKRIEDPTKVEGKVVFPAS